MRRRRALGVLGLAVLASATAACDGDATAARQSTPAEELAAAKKAFDEARFVTFTLSSTKVPQRANGVTGAAGVGAVSATEPRFKGSITGTVKGVTGNVELVTIGGAAWMKFFTPTYVKTDLATLGAPNPSTFFDPATGISSLITETAGVAETDKIRQGKEILRQFTGTLPGKRVHDLLLVGTESATFDVTYGVSDTHQLRTATITGPFFEGGDSTYRVVLQDYGRAVEITQP